MSISRHKKWLTRVAIYVRLYQAKGRKIAEEYRSRFDETKFIRALAQYKVVR